MTDNDRLDTLVDMYHKNQWFLLHSPYDPAWMFENEVLYQKMIPLIPQSHYDEINKVVYGIERRS